MPTWFLEINKSKVKEKQMPKVNQSGTSGGGGGGVERIY